MEGLRARDLRTVLEVARLAGEAEDLDAYRSTVLACAPRLVPGDVYGYNEIPPGGGLPLVLMSAYPAATVWWSSLERLAAEHPLVLHIIGTGDNDARAISDLMGRRVYEGSAFYRDVLSHVSGRDQLAVSMTGRGGEVIGLAVNRDRRGFSRRDHAMYDSVRPFLVQAYRNAVAHDELRALRAAAAPDPGDLRLLGLTPREADVLALVGGGAPNAEVARTLGISDETVAKHLTHVYSKLGVTSRTAAVARARELLRPPASPARGA